MDRKRFTGGLLISADEAARDVSDVSMFLLAGCGISPDKRGHITAKIGALEGDLARKSGGAVTAFHAKDIMNPKLWPDGSLRMRLASIRSMASIARTNRVSKFITAGALKSAGATEKRYLRDQVFSAYTLRTLQRATDSGIIPTFGFDEVQRGKKNGWAEECMVGIRRYPLFVWCSRGAHIPPIEHVPPGSTLESKLADCLAFIAAREFERRMMGSPVDAETKWFGYAQYSGFNGEGHLITSDGIGFPWRKVFGFKSAR